MPAARRLRLLALISVLAVLVVIYVSTGRSSTYKSPFYTRTVAAIHARQDSEARAGAIAEEKTRQERVARLQEEHDIAVGKAETDKQKAAAVEVKEATETKAAGEAAAPVAPPPAGKEQDDGGKSIAGRKLLNDGKVVVNAKATGNDGVAKIGNVPFKDSSSGNVNPASDAENERNAQAEMNAILKKGAIIIFSKSYCPHSKKAKDILLNKYSISPPPFVVELDTHPLGQALQASLGKTTGRATVPNVLINGKSIGGGDDIEKLHNDGHLIDTVSSMGGKRIMSIKRSEGKPAKPQKREVKYKS